MSPPMTSWCCRTPGRDAPGHAGSRLSADTEQARQAGGLKDMVRISDARLSVTAFGTIVLHVVPEADLGGQLALVRSGDRIRLSAG